jgi:ribulose-phosphate 3-epimerase
LPRPAVAPSILACDFAHLAEEIAKVEAAGADLLHVDVMDGHFVPNLTIGPAVVEKIRAVTDLFLDVHLMVEEPGRFIEAFAKAGADNLTFHAEVVADAQALADRIHALGASAGVTINPDTPTELLRPAVAPADLVLVMTVPAGFGGQPFRRDMVPRIAEVRSWLRPGQRLEVDGGIDPQNVGETASAGADMFVAGTSIFRRQGGDYAAAITDLRQNIQAATRK